MLFSIIFIVIIICYYLYAGYVFRVHNVADILWLQVIVHFLALIIFHVVTNNNAVDIL